jgi:hypothetical protein
MTRQAADARASADRPPRELDCAPPDVVRLPSADGVQA